MNTEQELRKKFLNDYADYVNATIVHMEITGERNHVVFEEEAEWVADFWLIERRKELEELRGKVEGMRYSEPLLLGTSERVEDIVKAVNQNLDDVLALINSELK